MHSQSFSKAAGAPTAAPTAPAPSATVSAAAPQQPAMDTAQGQFGVMAEDPTSGFTLEFAGVDTSDVLENFDFDSFLHTDDGGGMMDTNFFDNGLPDGAPV
jgi:septal ring-binding cell division protein DamX